MLMTFLQRKFLTFGYSLMLTVKNCWLEHIDTAAACAIYDEIPD